MSEDGGTPDSFPSRHIGPSAASLALMREEIGVTGASTVANAMPADVMSAGHGGSTIPPAVSEAEMLEELRHIAALNVPRHSMIGLGYYGTILPPVLQRNILENPAWYTAYTPYQPEISQGRLEALMNFQTMVSDLTGLPVANASLLDEATAAAEAMILAARVGKVALGSRGVEQAAPRFAYDTELFPQTVAVLATRAEALGIALVPFRTGEEPVPEGAFGVLAQYCGTSGRILGEITTVARQAHDAGAVFCVAADPLALCVMEAPGKIGAGEEERADVVIGSIQRFGLPLGFGGPHAGFMAVKEGLVRQIPGRLVGLSIDADNNSALRLALQTREQHIRREKATSNICTAQALLAIIASMYAVWHGPHGLKHIAQSVHKKASALATALAEAGVTLEHDEFFDTFALKTPGQAHDFAEVARTHGVWVWARDNDTVLVSCDEATTEADLLTVLATATDNPHAAETLTENLKDLEKVLDRVPASVQRQSPYLDDEVFNSNHSETAMMRYLRHLADRDYALDRGMIPLGSCTMKLNAAAEMAAITWPEFTGIHPFAPAEDAQGYRTIADNLESWLADLTGYDAVSLQPNAGSQGELSGLLAIRRYHIARGDHERTVCLVPASAHGTNAASTASAGFTVAVVAQADNGDIDLDSLDEVLIKNEGHVAAIMLTYPSTAGVYEDTLRAVCDKVHAAGGQVYIDGANFNAMIGWAKAGQLGGDVSHLNLHKTFAIPHGGGGPGIGPVAAKSHLAPFIPGHPLAPWGRCEQGNQPVSAAPFGSAGVLPISWAYIRLMGADGLRSATEAAVTNANWIATRLNPYFPVLFTNERGRVAHECILDIRPLTERTHVTVDDVAKRLIDYGFHAPTMSFPVAGTLMVEPTESEPFEELDRFCDAMIAIADEAQQVADGVWPADDNPLHNAPHTADCATATDWTHPYPRELAVYPAGDDQRDTKYWPPVRRIDNTYGDRNLIVRW